MMLVRMNHRLFTTESNNTKLSIIRFCCVRRQRPDMEYSMGSPTCELSSSSTWSYSLRATQKMIDVTFSKQWIHFLRSLR